MSDYDAILFLSFGGPEGMDDVMPFLQNVLRGKNVPESRMREVAHHYELFGGVSPINEQNRNLIKALEEELTRRKITLPVYWGNRNWHPLLPDTVDQMKKDGVKKAITFVTSAYSSYSSCRQYLEDIQRAVEAIPDAPQIDKVRPFYNHPDFIQANIQNVKTGLEQFDVNEQKSVHIAFTAHSIPNAMADTCAYHDQLLEACRLVCEADELKNQFGSQALVFQSRSGPPTQPWLAPDILDHIKDLHAQGIKLILVHPIGFVSDHMEVIYDLDHEARDLAKELGIKLIRSSTAGTNPLFARMMGDLLQERIQSNDSAATKPVERQSIGHNQAAPDVCRPECCAYTPARPPQKTAS